MEEKKYSESIDKIIEETKNKEGKELYVLLGRLIREIEKEREKLDSMEPTIEINSKMDELDALKRDTFNKMQDVNKKRYKDEFLRKKATFASIITVLPKGVGLAVERVKNCIKELKDAKTNKERIFKVADLAKGVGLTIATPFIYTAKFVVRHWYLLLLLLGLLHGFKFGGFNNGDNKDNHDYNHEQPQPEFVTDLENVGVTDEEVDLVGNPSEDLVTVANHYGIEVDQDTIDNLANDQTIVDAAETVKDGKVPDGIYAFAHPEEVNQIDVPDIHEVMNPLNKIPVGNVSETTTAVDTTPVNVEVVNETVPVGDTIEIVNDGKVPDGIYAFAHPEEVNQIDVPDIHEVMNPLNKIPVGNVSETTTAVDTTPVNVEVVNETLPVNETVPVGETVVNEVTSTTPAANIDNTGVETPEIEMVEEGEETSLLETVEKADETVETVPEKKELTYYDLIQQANADPVHVDALTSENFYEIMEQTIKENCPDVTNVFHSYQDALDYLIGFGLSTQEAEIALDGGYNGAFNDIKWITGKGGVFENTEEVLAAINGNQELVDGNINAFIDAHQAELFEILQEKSRQQDYFEFIKHLAPAELAVFLLYQAIQYGLAVPTSGLSLLAPG